MEFMVELSDGLSVYQHLLVAEKRLDIIAALLLEVQKQELHEGSRGSDFEVNILVHLIIRFTAKIAQIFVRAICSETLSGGHFFP